MAEYVYTGPHPVEDDGELVHPGDVREFGAEPEWGPWRCLRPDPAPPPVTTPAAPAATAADTKGT